jgi:hypothetical protein
MYRVCVYINICNLRQGAQGTYSLEDLWALFLFLIIMFPDVFGFLKSKFDVGCGQGYIMELFAGLLLFDTLFDTCDGFYTCLTHLTCVR